MIDWLPEDLITVAYYIGLFKVTMLLFAIGKSIYRNFIRKEENMPERYGEYTWACVTGCTQGIGEIYAEELARRGFNILFVNRN